VEPSVYREEEVEGMWKGLEVGDFDCAMAAGSGLMAVDVVERRWVDGFVGPYVGLVGSVAAAFLACSSREEP
jgi:hypothetical protein